MSSQRATRMSLSGSCADAVAGQETRSPGRLHCALRKFGWVCESYSDLVDLVVGVGHHRGSRHRLTSPGERFVGLVAEDIAQIGDGGSELGVRCCGEDTEGEASDGGRRFNASEPVAINCDMGESFGLDKIGDDEGLMPYITIDNISCGFHASDPTVMARTVR